MGENNLQKLAKNEMIEHFDYDAKKQIGFRKSCVGGKLHRNPFKRRTTGAGPLNMCIIFYGA